MSIYWILMAKLVQQVVVFLIQIQQNKSEIKHYQYKYYYILELLFMSSFSFQRKSEILKIYSILVGVK